MSFNSEDQRHIPSDSYSRVLDRRVAMDEYPYGYSEGEPPAGHYNGDGLLNDHYKQGKSEPQKAPWKEMKVRK